MKTKRYLFWDDTFVAEKENIEIRMHKPQKKNIALVCDDAWEGIHNGYCCVMKTPDGYRMYYRADATHHTTEGGRVCQRSVICVAESRDGITFTKPSLGIYEWGGTKSNNIVYDRGCNIDNFSVFYDENPACPKKEKYKALSEWTQGKERHLCCYISEDGYHFTRTDDIPVIGTFDTYNTLVWDPDTAQYFVYYRSYHRPNGDEIEDLWTTNLVSDVRDIRVATSKDFKAWTDHGRIGFAEGQKEYALYTNQIVKYYRAFDTFIGFPSRYTDHAYNKQNFKHMALADYREGIIQRYGREGTVVTDCVIMTSHDGKTFDRRDEAFFTPGPENRDNWWYGNCYPSYGMLETPAEERGASNEISLFMHENYRIKNSNFRRYTLRLDGFFSFFGPFSGATVTTQPLPVEGREMRLNFATSAAGGLTVTLLDEQGAPIEGYKSYEMFGDATDRPVEFEQPLSALKGRKVRLRFALRDAHLYSFCFE